MVAAERVEEGKDDVKGDEEVEGAGGKLRLALGLARAQNCRARLSAAGRSDVQAALTHVTRVSVNEELRSK